MFFTLILYRGLVTALNTLNMFFLNNNNNNNNNDYADDVKAQSCDLHHCQLLIGRLHQLTTIDDANDVPDTSSRCMFSQSASL